ncbi:MAG TPA: acyl-CoA thioesterase [Ramlibacter sp.]|nr:acyl-CoA thioesterase [Ramlibacter sp.]
MALTCRLARTLTWGECDPAGIIYYPTYYRWMDAASWAMLARAGFPARRMRQEQVSIPLVDAQCSFLSSPTFGDECEVRSWVSRWGRSSFSVSHEVYLLAEEERLLARGSESRVWCRYEAGPGSPLKGVPVPPEVRAALGEPA